MFPVRQNIKRSFCMKHLLNVSKFTPEELTLCKLHPFVHMLGIFKACFRSKVSNCYFNT